MSAVFITASGTEIGKTFVACGLIRALREHGRSVDALKPVVSGFDPRDAEASDPGLLLASLGRPVNEEEVAHISPWRFTAPLSPDMAARREGRAIDVAALAAFCRDRIAATDALVIEGVGGVMVPLTERHTVLTWISALEIPTVLVAGSYLGALSHTLAATDVLLRRKLPLSAIVVSETPDSPVPLSETVDVLRRFCKPIDVMALPRQPDASSDSPVFHRLTRLF